MGRKTSTARTNHNNSRFGGRMKHSFPAAAAAAARRPHEHGRGLQGFEGSEQSNTSAAAVSTCVNAARHGAAVQAHPNSAAVPTGMARRPVDEGTTQTKQVAQESVVDLLHPGATQTYQYKAVVHMLCQGCARTCQASTTHQHRSCA
jgi:hypothetical protein